MSKIEKFLCSVGIHEYVYNPPIYTGTTSELFGDPFSDAERKCNREGCTKHQYQEVHCLGLKPPKYVKTWINK